MHKEEEENISYIRMPQNNTFSVETENKPLCILQTLSFIPIPHDL